MTRFTSIFKNICIYSLFYIIIHSGLFVHFKYIYRTIIFVEISAARLDRSRLKIIIIIFFKYVKSLFTWVNNGYIKTTLPKAE